MKKTLLILCAAFAIGGRTALAQEKMDTRTVETGHLSGVEARSGFDVILKQGASSGAVISVDSRLEPYLQVEIEDGILRIGFDNIPIGLQRRNLARKAEITVNALERLDVRSGARVVGSGSFTAQACGIDVRSGASVSGIDIAAKIVGVDVRSGAKAVVSGFADRLEASTSSGSTANLRDLQAQDVQADASSGSSLRCCATRSIRGRASSGASVRYAGGATQVNTGSSSGGSYGPMK